MPHSKNPKQPEKDREYTPYSAGGAEYRGQLKGAGDGSLINPLAIIHGGRILVRAHGGLPMILYEPSM